MDLKVSATEPARQSNACVVVALFEGNGLSESASSIDSLSNGAIKRAIKRGDIQGQIGKSLVLHELPEIKADRVLIVGAGEKGKLAERQYRELCSEIAKQLRSTGAKQAIVHVPADISVSNRDVAWNCQQMAQILGASDYQFNKHKSEAAQTESAIEKAVLIVDKSVVANAGKAVSRGHAIASGMAMARNLGNLAPNICTPDYLAEQARSLAASHPQMKTKILDETRMAKLGMGALLAVSRGSRQPAKLICMEYSGGKKDAAPVVLVGKGVTFDTGGISIKGSAGMDEMKFDMCGAASVFGAMQSICELQPKCNVIGVVAAAENMPDGDASRPGDVVKTMSGLTVEILNTDAEGRLVLCDALTYVERYKPAIVIDIATLTGACVVALGKVSSAVLSNEQSLANALMQAGQSSGDLAWQMPLWDEYQAQLDSNFADLANIGGSPAGAITAACFLSRFATQYSWAHLDIAGVAWLGGKEKGATGRPVPLLMQYLLDNHV